MKRLSANEKAAYTLCAAMLALFLCTAILAVSLISMLSKTEKAYSRYRTEAEIERSELEKKKNELNSKATELLNSLELAEKTKAQLEMRIGQTEAELNELKSSFGNTDELYKKLNAQLSVLNGELEAKNTEIESLKNDISELSKTYSADINKQYGLLCELYELLASPPKLTVSEAEYGADGSVLKEAVYATPKISLYYEDIERGHTFFHNISTQYPTSGCLRIPFALSVLKAASDEMAEYEKKLIEYEAMNGPTDSLPNFTFKYDLNRIFTYTEDKQVAGSGIIKDSEFGTEYTHIELFEAYLKYGDAVAEKELTAVYGTSLRKTLLANIGTEVMKTDPASTTASDLALVMKAAFSFIQSDAYYSDLLRSSMKDSVHNVMISPGIVGKDVLHGSGWDEGAYHDMAIVDGEHPYVLIFMSDLSGGGDEVNQYINKLASVINQLHETFYN